MRTALVALAASLAAVMLGWQVAEGAYAWPALAAVTIVAAVLVRLIGLPFDTIFTGFLLIGYIVGNRGFAQLMPVPNLPLLPAEIGLALATACLLVRCAFERRLPFRKDALNWAVLAWLAVGSVRVPFDVPRHGFLALRDYALVYYAVFFFLVQHMAREAAARRYLIGCLLAALLALGPVYALFRGFESFFVTQLTFAGAPLIYFKGDIAATYLVIGALLIHHWAQGRQRLWAWPVAAGLFLSVMASDSRAAQLGALVAVVLLLLARRWRFPALHGGVTALALVVVVALAVFFDNTWARRKLHGVADRLQSVVDVTGTRTYTSEESFFKGDNNRYRLIWWKNVVEATWQENPAFGLGFGADLAHDFVQEYYPDLTEDFGIRSPHNVFITIFGRLGFVGLAVWGMFCACVVGATWRALHRSDRPPDWALWCAVCVILCSATFGVVLEGPMGAVVFWTLLGLAGSPSGPEAAAADVVAEGETARDGDAGAEQRA